MQTTAVNTNRQLTKEQKAIINSTGNLKINAVAGSGKTTTIIEYAASRPTTSKILYLAFNKSVKQEATRKFKERGLHNVKVETAHSLAFKHIIPKYQYRIKAQGYKTQEIAELLGINGNGEKHAEYIIANHINKFITYFCNSDKQKVQELNYLDTIFDNKAKSFVTSFYKYILDGTRLLLSKMNKGEIEITHDFYLKKFQLSNPVLHYDYILFDEGQDASAAMLDIFLKQKATKLIVGDAHQQIYGWRYAVNSLEKTNFTDYHLTTSFRFNQHIANLAIEILNWKNHLHECSPVAITGKGAGSNGKSKATIARSNLGLLLKAIEFIEEHKDVKHIYFEGNISSYAYADDGASLYDVLNLYNGKHEKINDKLIQSMTTLDELEEYIEKTEDMQLSTMVEIVKEYGNDIYDLIKSLKALHDDDRTKAEMIFSTVHRAKGMEYDAIQLVNDFVTESKLERMVKEGKEEEEINISKWNEEINLLCVAVTRTKGLLRIPEELLPKNFPSANNIHIIKAKKETDIEAEFPHLFYYKKTANTTTKIKFHPPAKAYTLEERREKHKQAYQPWSPELDNELKEMYYKGIRLFQIADHFGRTTGAIASRLKKIGCIDY
jgi:superfamily I DNA/RNA helicase